MFHMELLLTGTLLCVGLKHISGDPKIVLCNIWMAPKGRMALPNWMNFRKQSEQPSTPPHFRNIMVQFFYNGYGRIYGKRCEGQIV